MELKSLRGGSWFAFPALCRSDLHNEYWREVCNDFAVIGFRLVIQEKKDEN